MTEFKYRVREVKRRPKNKPWYEMQIGRIRDNSPINPGKWLWRCTCGKCSGNFMGPFETERAAEEDFKRWVIEVEMSHDSTKH